MCDDSKATLLELVRQGNLDEVKTHMDQHPQDFHVVDKDMRLPIHHAAEKGHLDLTKFLFHNLSDKESIDLDDRYCWTPLMIACAEGHKEVVRFLLDSGANASFADAGRGSTPLHITAFKEFPEIVEMLIEKGADVNAQDTMGVRPLLRAVAKGNAKTVEVLLSHPEIHINYTDQLKGNTALHYACETKQAEIATMLVKRGALLDTLNQDEKTPLSLADEPLRDTLKQSAQPA